MTILVSKKTGVIVQGITGTQGRFHTAQMLAYGTKIIAGVTPGKGGQMVERVPVFDTVKEALKFSPAEYSIIFVPAEHAADAALEALEADLNIILITEHMPVRDAMKIFRLARKKNKIMIGPNCPGLIAPGKCKIGIMPGDVFSEGKIGILSRSGTLTYEIAAGLTKNGFGQSLVLGIGGDFINGYNFIEGLDAMEKDSRTKAIVLIGEIGGDAEERAAAYIKKNISKPVISFIAGKSAPPEKQMGHAGAIISEGSGSYDSKISALKKAGVLIAEAPDKIPSLLINIKL